MNDSRLIFDYLRQRKQLYTIVLASFYLSRRVDENSVRIIIETKFDGRRESQFLSALRQNYLLHFNACTNFVDCKRSVDDLRLSFGIKYFMRISATEGHQQSACIVV